MAQLIIEGSESKLKYFQELFRKLGLAKSRIKSDEDVIDEKMARGIAEGLKGDFVDRKDILKALK